MSYRDLYNEWLSNPYFDEKTKEELKAISNDEKEIEERFYTDLEFGTAGLRGIIGAGTNRMNIYIVRKATQGLANYIVKMNQQEKGVAIAYDSRRMSPEFADEAARVLCANGIKAYIFESLRPTPELSFAVRELGCTAGINVTASHNPAEYNGYKVYWADGAQITPPHDKGIMDEVKAITDLSTVKTMTKEAAVETGLYTVIGSEIDDKYMEVLKAQIKNQDVIDEMQKDIKIVYTPLHGTGNIPARRVLKEIGFENVYVVKEQELPDGNFPTVPYPNPEAKEAFALALKLAEEVDADLVLATDPDADRLGVYVKDSKTGEYHALTGNMSGCLLADYEISQIKAKGQMPEDGALIRSIVTTTMSDAIAEYYGAKAIHVLTGFKYIGEQILKFEQTGKGSYLFGFEESYGCLIGTYARDKDAIVATMALCEAAVKAQTLRRDVRPLLVRCRPKNLVKRSMEKVRSGVHPRNHLGVILKSRLERTCGCRARQLLMLAVRLLKSGDIDLKPLLLRQLKRHLKRISKRIVKLEGGLARYLRLTVSLKLFRDLREHRRTLIKGLVEAVFLRLKIQLATGKVLGKLWIHVLVLLAYRLGKLHRESGSDAEEAAVAHGAADETAQHVVCPYVSGLDPALRVAKDEGSRAHVVCYNAARTGLKILVLRRYRRKLIYLRHYRSEDFRIEHGGQP